MKNTLYAAVAASMAMLATSGIIALATAAPPPTQTHVEQSSAALEAYLDAHIGAHLAALRSKLAAPHLAVVQ